MTYIKGLNAIRAFSIILVVLNHMDVFQSLLTPEMVDLRLAPMISGNFGVQVFFVLSGFLISHILLHERSQTGSINLKNFFIRRFLRLVPPLLVFFLLLGIAISQGYLSHTSDSVLYAVFYIYNFVPRELYSFEMGHFWSLGVEEQFYLFWPFTLTIVKRVNLLVIFLCLLILLCSILTLITHRFSLDQVYFISRWFIPASCPILIGCLGAVFNHYNRQYLQKLLSFNWLIIPLIFVMYSFSLYAPIALIPLGISVRSVAILLFILKIYHSQQRKWVQALEFAPLSYIGIISYGIYVYQGFFLRTGGGSDVWFQLFPVNILFTLVIAVISYELIEKQALKLKQKFK